MTRFVLAAALLLLAGCASSQQRLSLDKTRSDAALLTASAKAQLDAGNFAHAFDLSAAALARDPKNNEARIAYAETALRAGNPREALKAYAALEGVPEYTDRAHRGKAAAQFALGDADAALATLEAAIAGAPSPETLVAFARLTALRQDWAKSNAAYETAIRLRPTAQIYNDYGAALIAQHQYGAAQQAFVHALEIDPALAEAQNNLRLTYAWEGRYDRALADVSPGQRPQILNNVGYIAMQRGDRANAKLFLLEALRSSPTFYKRAADNLQALQATTSAPP
jgi:Tfp pilus assembly protein PilF